MLGTIPSSFDQLTSLETLFVFSNRFVCDCPGMNNAARLGQGRFSGIVNPALQELYTYMFRSTVIGAVQYIQYRTEAARNVPTVKNAVLIYTGFHQLSRLAA